MESALAYGLCISMSDARAWEERDKETEEERARARGPRVWERRRREEGEWEEGLAFDETDALADFATMESMGGRAPAVSSLVSALRGWDAKSELLEHRSRGLLDDAVDKTGLNRVFATDPTLLAQYVRRSEETERFLAGTGAGMEELGLPPWVPPLGSHFEALWGAADKIAYPTFSGWSGDRKKKVRGERRGEQRRAEKSRGEQRESLLCCCCGTLLKSYLSVLINITCPLSSPPLLSPFSPHLSPLLTAGSGVH